MAATSTKLQNTLVLKYKAGVNKNGKDVIKKQSFKSIKPAATEQDMYDVAKQIETLLGTTLNELLVDQESSITNA